MSTDLENHIPLDDVPGLENVVRTPTARERAQEALSRGQQHAGEALARGHQAVRENPWPALGVAFGAGMVVGLLLFREHREPTMLEAAQSSLGKALHEASDRLVDFKAHARSFDPTSVTAPVTAFFRKLAA